MDGYGTRVEIILPSSRRLPALRPSVEIGEQQGILEALSGSARSILERLTVIPFDKGISIAEGGRSVRLTRDGATFLPPNSKASDWANMFTIRTTDRPYGIVLPDNTEIVVVTDTSSGS